MNKATIGAISAIVGVVIGGGIVWGMHSMKAEDTTPGTSTTPSTSQMTSADSDGVTVGGAKMVSSKDIVDNAVNAKNVTTVVSLVKLAGLVDTLKSTGPFTVFAPDNDAFAKLPTETVTAVQKPENVGTLKTILTYHVVAGTYTTADLRAMATKGEKLTTVQGQELTPTVENNAIVLVDAMGGKINIKTSDVISSNGVTHVVDSVMMPKS